MYDAHGHKMFTMTDVREVAFHLGLTGMFNDLPAGKATECVFAILEAREAFVGSIGKRK